MDSVGTFARSGIGPRTWRIGGRSEAFSARCLDRFRWDPGDAQRRHRARREVREGWERGREGGRPTPPRGEDHAPRGLGARGRDPTCRPPRRDGRVRVRARAASGRRPRARRATRAPPGADHRDLGWGRLLHSPHPRAGGDPMAVPFRYLGPGFWRTPWGRPPVRARHLPALRHLQGAGGPLGPAAYGRLHRGWQHGPVRRRGRRCGLRPAPTSHLLPVPEHPV